MAWVLISHVGNPKAADNPKPQPDTGTGCSDALYYP